MNSALLLIDVQRDYFPGGRMELTGANEAAQKAGLLLSVFRAQNLPVIHIRHLSVREGAAFFLPNTDGIEFNENVRPLDDETVIEKHYPNSFRETGLGAILDRLGIDRIVAGGMMSHMCVDATVRAAFDAGYTCLVAHDACATRDLSFNGVDVSAKQVQAAFMAALSSVYAQLASTEEIIDSLKRQ
ncbi:MAG: cysteine hydrolase family protein [Syntrophobacteraceae bacterium]